MTDEWRIFWQEYLKAFRDDTLDKPNVLKRLGKLFKFISGVYSENLLKRTTQNLNKSLKKSQNTFYSIFKEHKGKGFLTGWQMDDLRDEVKRELQRRTELSLNLIKSSNEKHKQILRDRFYGAMSGKDLSPKAMADALGIKDLDKKTLRHQELIIEDQTNKFEATLSQIEAENTGAIGFMWRTMKDSKVVGNPAGLYPKGTEKHENHYIRDGKYYFLKSQYPTNFIYRKKLVKASALTWDDFNDGMPGMPINCRCLANYFYDIRDLPKAELDKILTKKGWKFVNGEAI